MARSVKKMYEVLDSLPEEKRKAVLDFAEYLRFREIEEAGVTAQIVEGIKQVKGKRVRPARELLDDLS